MCEARDFKVGRVLIVAFCLGLCACAARAGSVPMAGYRNQSTACAFGLRGVRVSLDDTEPDSVDVTIRMSSDKKGLGHCARALLGFGDPTKNDAPVDASANSSVSSGANGAGAQRLEIDHQLATASVSDIRGGVHIRVIPDRASDIDVIRDELSARIGRASDDSRCN
jgi:hypothetical protein